MDEIEQDEGGRGVGGKSDQDQRGEPFLTVPARFAADESESYNSTPQLYRSSSSWLRPYSGSPRTRSAIDPSLSSTGQFS